VHLFGNDSPDQPKRQQNLNVNQQGWSSQERGSDQICVKSQEIREDPGKRKDKEVRKNKKGYEKLGMLS
jgi:hypothetical protein